jgi:3'(2'), 5'-bisphosphate nucleotidase
MIDLNNPEVKFAFSAVQQAGLLVKQVQSELVSSTLTKDDRSPVTVADFASQALIAQRLFEVFPDDPLVGEEDATELRKTGARSVLEQVTRFVSRYTANATPETVCDWIDRGNADPAHRFWTLDPIDGTKGFLRGDQYAVALALVVDGKVQIGALGCPNLNNAYLPNPEGPGSLIIAVRGEGTWTTPLTTEGGFEPLSVSGLGDASKARLLRSFESGHTNAGQIDEFAQVLGVEAEPVRMDSQGKYGVLAAGKGELLLRLLSPAKPDYKEKIWDQAAGSLVIEEAGGKITDLHGKALDFNAGKTLANNRGILASNANLHEQALIALRKIAA